MKEINIEIKGQAGTGKSTIAHLIQKVLLENNIVCDVKGDSYDHNFKSNNIQNKINSLNINGLNVKIIEIQTPR